MVWLRKLPCHLSLQLPWQVGDRTVLSLPSAEKSESATQEQKQLSERLKDEAEQKEQLRRLKNEMENERWHLDKTIEKLQKEVRGRRWEGMGPAFTPTVLEGLTELREQTCSVSQHL